MPLERGRTEILELGLCSMALASAYFSGFIASYISHTLSSCQTTCHAILWVYIFLMLLPLCGTPSPPLFCLYKTNLTHLLNKCFLASTMWNWLPFLPFPVLLMYFSYSTCSIYFLLDYNLEADTVFYFFSVSTKKEGEEKNQCSPLILSVCVQLPLDW